MTNSLFHKIDDAFAVLYGRGKYIQTELYHRADRGKHNLYARHGGGFIKLAGKGSTSHKYLSYLNIHFDDQYLLYDSLGYPHVCPRYFD